MKSEAEIIGSARIAERRRAVRRERRRLRRRISVGVVLVIAAAVGALSLSRSSVFRLERIEVAGASSVPTDRIIAASGLHPGVPVLGVDLDAAATAVRSLPQIAHVRIDRVDGVALRITVTERVPAIEVRVGERRFLLDETGATLDPSAKGARLPVMYVSEIVDDAPVVDPAAVHIALKFWRRAGSSLRARIDSLAVTGGQLTFASGRTTVVVGSLDRLAIKLGVLESIRRRARSDGRRLLYLDLRSPARPSARLA